MQILCYGKTWDYDGYDPGESKSILQITNDLEINANDYPIKCFCNNNGSAAKARTTEIIITEYIKSILEYKQGEYVSTSIMYEMYKKECNKLDIRSQYNTQISLNNYPKYIQQIERNFQGG